MKTPYNKKLDIYLNKNLPQGHKSWRRIIIIFCLSHSYFIEAQNLLAPYYMCSNTNYMLDIIFDKQYRFDNSLSS